MPPIASPATRSAILQRPPAANAYASLSFRASREPVLGRPHMLRRLATLSACAVALALASPAAAHAASHTLVDTRGDVWAMDTPEAGQNTQVPQHQQGDILRTLFRHKDRQVVVRTTFSELDRVGRMSIVAIKLRTNTGMLRRISLFAGPGRDTHRCAESSSAAMVGPWSVRAIASTMTPT